MRIQELRVGDIVKENGKEFPFVVTGLFGDKDVQAVPDVEDYEGDVWEFCVDDLEFVEPRYTLPEWSEVEGCRDFIVIKAENSVFRIEYKISSYGLKFSLHTKACFGHTSITSTPKTFSTIEEAKEYAQRDYNKVMTSLREVV